MGSPKTGDEKKVGRLSAEGVLTAGEVRSACSFMQTSPNGIELDGKLAKAIGTLALWKVHGLLCPHCGKEFIDD